MDAMVMAKKKVLGDLIKEMRARMVAPGEDPEASSETAEPETEPTSEMEPAVESEGACEGCGKTPCECGDTELVSGGKKGVTITLAAIKNASKAGMKRHSAPAAEGSMPSVLEHALMSKDKERSKKKA